MRLSKLFFRSSKDHGRIYSFINQDFSGVYQYGPLAVSMLEKICFIVRTELNSINCQEVLLPILQEEEVLIRSGRIESYGEEMFRLKDRKEKKLFLSPTSEEACLELVKSFITHKKQLPVTLYQINEKYRDELRPRFGLIRTRSFRMKDAYSFDIDIDSAKESYKNMYNAYLRIFKKLGLSPKVLRSDPGPIGGDFSHEFLIETELGESLLPKEIKEAEPITDLDQLPKEILSKDYLNEENGVKALEIGEIFLLNTAYSRKDRMNGTVDGKEFVMGCYGIGISRIMALLLSKKVIEPKVSPFLFFIVSIDRQRSEELYKDLHELHGYILYDDREKSAGIQFTDCELLGIPYRIVVSENKFELTDMKTDEKKAMDKTELIEELIKIVQNVTA